MRCPAVLTSIALSLISSGQFAPPVRIAHTEVKEPLVTFSHDADGDGDEDILVIGNSGNVAYGGTAAMGYYCIGVRGKWEWTF
jgi:hypothetical protein